MALYLLLNQHARIHHHSNQVVTECASKKSKKVLFLLTAQPGYPLYYPILLFLFPVQRNMLHHFHYILKNVSLYYSFQLFLDFLFDSDVPVFAPLAFYLCSPHIVSDISDMLSSKPLWMYCN
ncbi:hypothetical protein XELAEV_18010599mg [Xenopus laevis]|uniref:Uncharacterized protein n=1 Tax=Xenopus laevis TaxID=8355 RepID=A0A974DWY7_XENLA|nr:hypothetical protein XELAEV_18010599mg [Xenopus laevis]